MVVIVITAITRSVKIGQSIDYSPPAQNLDNDHGLLIYNMYKIRKEI